MSVHSLAAFVLHGYDWSESSLIVELFTREVGRVAVVAKGAKRPTSNLRAVLLPFQRIGVAFGRQRDESASEIRNLRAAEWGGGAPIGGGDALLAGFYLNELLMKLLARDDPHPALWDAYAATLPRLGGEREAAALRAFELVLLAETGHLPDLSLVTATQQPIDPAHGYALAAEQGVGASRRAQDAIAGADLIALQAALTTRDLDAMAETVQRCEGALRRQSRALLAYHLGGAPLRTREVVRDLQPLLAAG